jgi:hypothetical protein
MYSYATLRRRADQYHDLVLARIRQLCSEGGLPGDASGAEYRRAMAACERGRPWPGVDYQKIRKALWLRRHRLWAAHMLLARLVLHGRTDINQLSQTSKEAIRGFTEPTAH